VCSLPCVISRTCTPSISISRIIHNTLNGPSCACTTTGVIPLLLNYDFEMDSDAALKEAVDAIRDMGISSSGQRSKLLQIVPPSCLFASLGPESFPFLCSMAVQPHSTTRSGKPQLIISADVCCDVLVSLPEWSQSRALTLNA
jgi:hypothetical protein